MAGRSMLGRRPSRKIAEAITAPELAAEYTAMASPCLTRSMALLMLASRFLRTIVASSCMPIEGPLGTSSINPRATAPLSWSCRSMAATRVRPNNPALALA